MGQCCVNDNATKRQKKRKATVATNPLVAINALKSKKCITEGEVKAYVNAFFAKYDSNGDGFIDRQEVKAMLKDDIASNKRQIISDKSLNNYVDNFMDKADLDQDDKISKEDFYNFYKTK